MAIEPTRASWDSTPQGVRLAEAVLAAHTRFASTILDSPDEYRAKAPPPVRAGHRPPVWVC
jgi:hypothetical protein